MLNMQIYKKIGEQCQHVLKKAIDTARKSFQRGGLTLPTIFFKIFTII